MLTDPIEATISPKIKERCKLRTLVELQIIHQETNRFGENRKSETHSTEMSNFEILSHTT
jgi:hypothetical protein